MAPEEGATVNEALKASPYTADHKQEVEQAIDAKVGMSVKQAKAPQPGAAKQQLLKHIWNYPTQAEWDVLLDAKKNFSSKASCLVHRLCLIGCNHPDEQSLKWALALLLMCCYQELPAPQTMVQTERATFAELPWIGTYPESPQDLPPPVWTHAYEEASPVSKDWPGIAAIAENLFLSGATASF